MQKDQKFTPKYWVAHDPSTDDVVIETASKDLMGCQRKAFEIFNLDEDLGNLKCDLVEIKIV